MWPNHCCSYGQTMWPNHCCSYGQTMWPNHCCSYGQTMWPDHCCSYGQTMWPDHCCSYGQTMWPNHCCSFVKAAVQSELRTVHCEVTTNCSLDTSFIEFRPTSRQLLDVFQGPGSSLSPFLKIYRS